METFVVRIWRPSPAYDTDGDQAELGRESLRGVVRRVADGTELPFAGVDELIDLLSATAASPAPDAGREQWRVRATTMNDTGRRRRARSPSG